MSADEEPSPPYYVFRAKVIGAPSEFMLGEDAIEWRRGAQSGRVPYSDVRRVRLGFRPVTLQNYRFLTEIWSNSGPKLAFASTSWRGIVEQERHDAAYAAFVAELHRRLAQAGGDVQYRCGSPALLYWPGVAIFVGLCIGVIMLAGHAVETQAWIGFAIAAAMLAFFLYQTGVFFWRNRPGSYTTDALPPRVMP